MANDIKQQLSAAAAALEAIEMCREESGIPDLCKKQERYIVERCLRGVAIDTVFDENERELSKK